MKNKRESIHDKNSATSTWMVSRSMRDLTARSIAVAANPTQIAIGSASPYPMLAPQNRIIDTNYAGYDNISGNIPIEIANNPQSKYLLAYDNAVIRMHLNYNYMAISPTDKNVAVNKEYIKAMNESLSNAFAETFTELPFFDYYITSDMPGMNEDGTSSDNILAFATFYQTILQNIALIVSKYNQMLSLEQVLYNQSWLRETPQLKQLYGLFKKKTLKASMEALANYIPGCALDTAWLTQTNILCNVPCKRSDSYEDPLITVNAYVTIPNIDVYLADKATKVFRYNEDESKSDYNTTVDSSIYSITDIVASIVEALSPYAITAWARQQFNGTSNTDAREYFNHVVDLIEGLTQTMSRFPRDIADFDVVLKVMRRVNLNNWHFGASLRVDEPGNYYKPVFNKLLYDVIAANCAGGATMTFDDNTRRWKYYTVWDRVEDIPDYDVRSGGAFLTFSLRKLPESTDYESTQWLIPILFGLESPVELLNRKGFTTSLSYAEYTYEQMSNSPVLSRLVPLPSMTDAVLRVPTISVTSDLETTIANASQATKFVTKLCGVGRVIYGSSSSDANLVLADSIMNLVDEQLEDVSNAMINQARVSSPFRTAVAEDKRTIGFVKVVN